jgi:hypothetical protein
VADLPDREAEEENPCRQHDEAAERVRNILQSEIADGVLQGGRYLVVLVQPGQAHGNGQAGEHNRHDTQGDPALDLHAGAQPHPDRGVLHEVFSLDCHPAGGTM